MGNMLKIGFIVNVYDTRTDTHLYHKYALISALRAIADVRILSMKGKMLGGIGQIMRAHREGVRDWYVHYSFKGAVTALVVTRLLGGRVFYWNCGMPWLYERGWFEEHLFRFILAHTILITGTRSLARMYASRYGLDEQHIRVLANGIDTSRFHATDHGTARVQLGIGQETHVVLFNHRLSRRKGAHMLPDIVEACREDAPLFVIVGSGPYEEELRGEIARRGLSRMVRFVGSVAQKDIPEYLAASDVFLMPSEEEGFPHVLLEAMAAGVPIVVSDVGGVREILPPELQAYVCSSSDTKEFARNIRALLHDATLRGTLGDIEQAWVMRYDIIAVRDAFIKLFS